MISNHRKMVLTAAIKDKEPDTVRVFSAFVHLFYGDYIISVRRSDLRVSIMFPDDGEIEFIETLGVRERAVLAIERGEGAVKTWKTADWIRQRKALAEGEERIRWAVAGL